MRSLNSAIAFFTILGFTATPASTQQAATGTTEKASNPFELVGVCAIKSVPRGWSVVWHPRASGVDQTATRVFRQLEAPDVNDCLTLLVESDDATRASLLRYVSDQSMEHGRAANEAVQRRWSSFGVDRAIQEVAETGRRGPLVERVLESCRQVRDPARMLGVPKEEEK